MSRRSPAPAAAPWPAASASPPAPPSTPERRFPSMFEPVHGSAPDIAGQGVANPIGAIGSAALMLDHPGLPDEAAHLDKAIEAATAAGVLNPDPGGGAGTAEVTAAVIDHLA